MNYNQQEVLSIVEFYQKNGRPPHKDEEVPLLSPAIIKKDGRFRQLAEWGSVTLISKIMQMEGYDIDPRWALEIEKCEEKYKNYN